MLSVMVCVRTEWPWLLYHHFTHPSRVTFQPQMGSYWVEDPGNHASGWFATADHGFAFTEREFGWKEIRR